MPRRGDDPDKKGIHSMNRHIPLRLSSWMHLVAVSLLLGLGVLTCSLVTPRTAHARPLDTFTITDCTDESQLRSAISNASSGETITFDCNGTIPITVANGPLTIATNLTLDGSGQSVTLDGQSQVQVLQVNSGVSFTLNALTIADGSSEFGGCLGNEGGSVSISNSTFSNNLVPNGGDGGGLFNESGTLSISNSRFSNSEAPNDFGAGVANGGGSVSISNSTFSNNSAEFGGGLYNAFGSVSIGASTLTNNSARFGGGFFNEDGTLSIAQSIMSTNSGGNCSGGESDQGYNLENGTDCGFTAGTDQQNTDPKLASSLANNGGPTQTLALRDGSPAINKIPTSACTLSTDQRGVSRPQGPACDIGAFEFRMPTLSLPSSPIP